MTKKVINLFTQEHLKGDDDLTVKLWFDNDTFVHATIANPFIVEGKYGVTAWNPKRGERVYTWIEEKWNQLEIGDEIIFNNGLTLEKTKLVKAEVYYEQIRTYDIEVEHTHTFFANGILTHNSPPPPPPPPPAPKKADVAKPVADYAAIERKRRGRQSTLMTAGGAQGLVGMENIQKKKFYLIFWHLVIVKIYWLNK